VAEFCFEIVMNIPACENCIYYRPGRYPHTGQCTRFIAYRGRGRVVYEFNDNVRLDSRQCGPDGKLFVGKRKNVHRPALTKLSFLDDDEE
jgi:hypothetical protein